MAISTPMTAETTRPATVHPEPDGAVDKEPQNEIRSMAVERVKKRMTWEPHHPLEREICEVAVDWAEQFLSEEKGRNR